jgi:hypothetical protein
VAQRPDLTSRRAQAVELRASGLGYEDIAVKLGHKTARAAAADVALGLESHEVLARVPSHLVAVLETARLDALERDAQRVLRAAATAGDHELVLRAVDQLVRLSARRAAAVAAAVAAPGQAGPVEARVRDDIGALVTQHPMGEALAEMSLHLARTLDGGAGLATAAVNRELRANLLELSRLAVDDNDELDAELSTAVRDGEDPEQV